MSWKRVHIEVRTIRVTFNAAHAQTRALPTQERGRAIAALVVRARALLQDVRQRASDGGGSIALLDAIDRASEDVARAA